MTTPRVSFRSWSLRFTDQTVDALRDVSLKLERGERVLVTGPSGGGKSTLVRAIAGLIDPVTVSESGVRSRSPESVAYVGQEPDEQILFPTIREEVAFVAETAVDSLDLVDARVTDALARAGVTNHPDTPTARLSGGEKQRVALATAMAARAGLIVLDEPTASLDEQSMAVVRESVTRVIRETSATLVLVEHHIELWKELATRMIVVADGRIVMDGPIDDLLETRHDELVDLGVWVPGRARTMSPLTVAPSAPLRLVARELVSTRRNGAPHIRIPSLSLRAGEAVAIVGANGSGKTATLRTLGGLVTPVAGVVEFSGAAQPPHQLSARVLARLAASVLQNPAYGFGNGTVADEAPALERAAVGLTASADRHPQSLSGGERRRLALAAALSREPDILFLDEPTFGQDARSWCTLRQRLRDYLAEGGSIVFASHDRLLVDSLANRVITIGSGE